MSLILSAIIFITSFLLVLSFLVFFHELGHYSVARMFNVAIDRFSIGFGKPIARWTDKSGTEWTFSRIPLGGYVRFLGDAGAASNPDRQHLEELKSDLSQKHGQDVINDCFHFKPLWQRALIVAAGPVANFILAIFLFGLVALFYGHNEYKSVVTMVQPGSAAEAAGVEVGDHFLTLDGRDVRMRDDFVSVIALSSNETLQAVVERDGYEVSLQLTPRRESRRDMIGGKNAIGTAGVRIGGRGNVVTHTYNPITAMGRGAEQTWHTVTMTGTYLKRIFTGREDGKALGGPVRIATMTGKVAVDITNQDSSLALKLKSLAYSLLVLSAALSVGLGVANLMPIPALDGGHLLYYGYEALAGRPLSEEKQEFGFRIGFALLFTALVFLTINDIGYVRSIFS